MNYSWDSQGMRHPNGPLGLVLRDEGQVQIYAGKSQSIWGIKGERVDISTNYHNLAERINFTSRGITNLRFLGRFFTKEIHDGQKVVAIKPNASIATYSVIGPETKVLVDGKIGEIISPVPMIRIFDERMIFDMDPNDKNLMPAGAEITKYVFNAMGVK